jgi:hypothetical protein
MSLPKMNPNLYFTSPLLLLNTNLPPHLITGTSHSLNTSHLSRAKERSVHQNTSHHMRVILNGI